jgi:hypothetical protein
MPAEQQFDLASQRLIPGAGLIEKGCALARCALQRLRKELFDLLPSLNSHGFTFG